MPTYRIERAGGRRDARRYAVVCELCGATVGDGGRAEAMTGLSAADVLRLYPALRPSVTRHEAECGIPRGAAG